MNNNVQNTTKSTTLPSYARLPINRCNLPAVILGSIIFQQHPVSLTLDGIDAIHHQFFDDLNREENEQLRAARFMDYMASCFLLDTPEEAGLSSKEENRRNDYLKLLRGWHFDPNSSEGAVLKSWVESRFGLVARNHHGPLRNFDSALYQRYLSERSRGLYNSNALESQLDLLYSFTQQQLRKNKTLHKHVTLYRGVNQLNQHEILSRVNTREYILILNNLNSFTLHHERADEFGDTVISCKVPVSKILFVPGLLPQSLKGEQEFLVIGGVYQVTCVQASSMK